MILTRFVERRMQVGYVAYARWKLVKWRMPRMGNLLRLLKAIGPSWMVKAGMCLLLDIQPWFGDSI